ncbi:MAG TPA: NADH-quinone oxidoreductase subunit NuoE [Candidatus Cloacimonas sp.]|nr:NADH-quinone oxidoreductase subunit NuoE [Candidatus Cloacimonas sp.]
MKNKKEIDLTISNFIGKKGSLIPLLQEIQKLEGYLPKETLRYLSQKTKIKLARIYGGATFYSMFRLKPQGKHIIRVCKGTACHVSGAEDIGKAIRKELKLGELEDTTDDGLFTVMEVACLGCCSLSPVMMVDDNTHGKLTPEKVTELLQKYK